jgi:hypothetical protein
MDLQNDCINSFWKTRYGSIGMTTEQFRKLLSAKPFRPFTLRTADGERLRVPHPEFALLSPGGRTAVIVTGDEEFEIVDLLLISALEVRNGARGNGRKKGR